MEIVAGSEFNCKKLQLWDEDWILILEPVSGEVLGKSLNTPEPHFVFYTIIKKK